MSIGESIDENEIIARMIYYSEQVINEVLHILIPDFKEIEDVYRTNGIEGELEKKVRDFRERLEFRLFK